MLSTRLDEATMRQTPATPEAAACRGPRPSVSARSVPEASRAHAIARTYCGPEVPQVRLVWLADVDEALATAAAARLGFEAWTTDRDEVVARPDVDLVSILLVAVAGGPPMTADFYDGWRALAVAEAVLAAADGGRVTVPPPPARGA
jgi:predicted dehydrogenase